jgi:hypothetical protein
MNQQNNLMKIVYPELPIESKLDPVLENAGINSMDGFFGTVYKLEIDGTPYFVKKVYANSIRPVRILNERF